MIIAPAMGIGICAIMLGAFVVGYGITRLVFHLVYLVGKNNHRLSGTAYRVTEKAINGLSITFGAILALLSFVITLELYRENASGVWLILVITGFIASALSFILPPLISSFERGSVKVYAGASSAYRERMAEKEAEELDKVRKQAKNQRQGYFDSHYRKVEKKRKSIVILVKGWVNVFSKIHIVSDICRRPFLRLLANWINDFILWSNIRVIDPLSNPRKHNRSEGIGNSVLGVIEIEGKLILLAIISAKRLLGRKEVSPLIVQLYNRDLPNLIIYTDSSYEESACITCREASRDKVIVLCGLAELSVAIEGKGTLKEHFLRKVATTIN